MKYTALTALLLCSASSAYAADAIIYSEPAPIIKINTFSWEGAYIGVNAGYGFGKTKETYTVGGTGHLKPRGFVGGIQAGYNWQLDQVVAGIEADFQGSSMKKSAPYYNVFDSELGYTEAKVQWFGTLRGRLGANIAERTMLYGTAGLAYGKVKYDTYNNVTDKHANHSKTRAGWTVGAGIEHAFTDKVSFKTEYLYTDLGKITLHNDPAEVAKIKTNFHTVRVGLNYKF
ncbi:outer membrane immunogenic protein [Paenochrobactrum gallinarii]|uniref:Outer membrane immunogenic protein n=1 Tax=Paenochrobactrum gallinarii TaxID=643673 RepID=A0A841M0I0_9HYPH|nr:outer membrane protein [Paenochrobactrum gallinarii]MBB6262257.1 outer membrane immunogenic protein [Paenochrobactrum gallinarii]